MKSKLIRLLSIAMSVILVILLACPAFAEEINYRDYVTSVKVDGDNDLVTVSFPTEWIEGRVAYEGGKTIVEWNGPHFQWSAYEHEYDRPTDTFQIYVAPFSFSFGAYNRPYYGRYLSLSNIPSDSVFEVGFSFGASAGTPNLVWESVRERFYSVTDDYASMYSNKIYDLSHYGGLGYTSSVQISPGTGEGWVPEYIFIVSDSLEIPDLSTYDWSFTVDYFSLQMSISSLYRLQEQSGITNDLLTEVNKQLAEQGKTMEDILNGTPEQNEVAGNISGALTDKGEQLGGLVDDIQTEKPNLDSVDVDKIIPQAGITTLSDAISPIAENPLIIKILVMVGTLLLVSYVLFGKRG